MKTTEKLIEIKINNERMTELSAKAIINTAKATKIISYMMLIVAWTMLFIGAFLGIWEWCRFSLIAMITCCGWLGIIAISKTILKRI